MDKIIFKAAFGDVDKLVVLSDVAGRSENTNYHIMIDNFYNGSINYMLGGYRVNLYSDEFTSADADALLDIVEGRVKPS